jgi:hypothetical protein
MRCEIITSPVLLTCALAILREMHEKAPIRTVLRLEYEGDCEWLMTYGIGDHERGGWFRDHVMSGRHAITWDLPYWDRKNRPDRPMRLSIDAMHPQKWIDDRPPSRWDRQGIALREDYDPDGPIILVGLGAKQNTALRQECLTWEKKRLPQIREVYPNARIVYRPKRLEDPSMPDLDRNDETPIDKVLRGASLVVCRHSNVAIDACIAGVPVVCDDGAASALYGGDLRQPVYPSHEERLRFLRNLAWYQWQPSEAKECWAFLLQRIGQGVRLKEAALA